MVYYGLYSQLHGVETIIKAAEKLKNISVTFLLVGKGYTLADNQTLMKKLNLTNIKFLTALTEANSLATLSKGHIFLGFFRNTQ
ncbi:hypothetical protein IPH70_02270 [Candidatus Roizmanbacteria bacterium]|nr:MAG: hypothetical protein IPH70_02270 [Candidatus Roizmanbacteria bacterium]